MPGGFHPFHAGHKALYDAALRSFPDADVYVAATDDTSTRPFPFAVKEKLAKLAGVKPGHFIRVKSPFRAEEITKNYNPEDTVLIFVRSTKDQDKPPKPGGVKRDGSMAYLQPYGDDPAPIAQHGYMAYLPTVEFAGGLTSATEIRNAWPALSDDKKQALVMKLYPRTSNNAGLAANVVKLLDTAIGAIQESKPLDPEMLAARLKSKLRYTPYSKDDEDAAFDKFVQRSLKHSEEDSRRHEREIDDLESRISKIERQLGRLLEGVVRMVREQRQRDNGDYIEEKWSQKYKRSINCDRPQGFSQKAHCAGRKK